MKKSLLIAPLAALLALLVPAPAVTADAPATDDGLVPIQVKNVDKVYKRPGASLKGYSRILIRPVSVAFSKSWNPHDYGGTFGLKSGEVEKIRTSLAKLTGDTFARVLSRGGYAVATAPGENVLDVEAEIVDLYVNAPDTNSRPDVKSYVLNAGEMRILVTLRDSVTGTTLYRASDFKRGFDYGHLEWANSVWNAVEAERVLTIWAGQLKDALDAARAN